METKNITKIPVKVLSNGGGLDLPSYATAESAGLDLRAAISDTVILKPMERALVPTGIAVAIPHGCEGQVRPRSGLAYKHGITVLNTPGTIDSDYRGEVKVLLINLGSEDFVVERGMRIAQLVINKYEKVVLEKCAEIDDTTRSSGGYGSTGVR